MHYVKYNALIPGLLFIPSFELVRLSQPLKAACVLFTDRKTASHSHCFIALLIAS